MKVINLKCPGCGANIEIEDGRSCCFCQYCGCKIRVDDEKHEYTYNENVNETFNKNINIHKRYTNDAEVIHEKAQEKEEKHLWLGMFLILLVPFLMLAKYDIDEKIAIKEGKINAGDCDDLVGENYQSVEAHFKAAGFTNIEIIDLNDSGIAFWNNEDVATISVGGNTDFDTTDWFDPDTKVAISYH